MDLDDLQPETRYCVGAQAYNLTSPGGTATFSQESGRFCATTLLMAASVYRRPAGDLELPNRIPEAAPYVTAEAESVPPPFEDFWQQLDHPAQCQTCHARVFNEWNGSMMANAWRDPVWRAAFLLSARETSTSGDCEVPQPPDGTPRASHNPFADPHDCASAFDLGTSRHRLARAGSLVDSMCARCHMPTNYVDNVPLQNVGVDVPSPVQIRRKNGRNRSWFVVEFR